MLAFCTSRQQVLSPKDFVSEIPEDFQDSAHAYFAKNIYKMLGLHDIKEGVKGIEMRFWVEYLYSDIEDLIIIKDSNSSYYGEWYRLKYNYSGRRNRKLDSISVVKEQLEPLCEWSSIVDTLHQIGVQKGLDYSKLPGFDKSANVSSSYVAEYATSYMYRIYRVNASCLHQSNNEGRRACDIVSLFERQTKFKRLLKDW